MAKEGGVMTTRSLYGCGLFLAACAAFALGFGLPQNAQAAGEADGTPTVRVDPDRVKLAARLHAERRAE